MLPEAQWYPGLEGFSWSVWHLVKKTTTQQTRGPKDRINVLIFISATRQLPTVRSDICRSRLSVFRLGSGRWPRSPAPWSGRNARRGNPTATGSRLRNVAPVPAKTPALSARGISWGSSAKSVSAAARKDPFGGDQVSAVDFFLFLLLFSLNWCVLRLCMEAVSPNLPPPPPPRATPPLFEAAEALYCSQGLQSEPEEKVDFLRGAKKKEKRIHLFHEVFLLSVYPTATLPHIPSGTGQNARWMIYMPWRYRFMHRDSALIRIIN